MFQFKTALFLTAWFAAAAPVAQTPTWSHQAPLPTGRDLFGARMTSTTEMWVTSDGGIGSVGFLLHSTDGGRTWEKIHLGRGAALWDVFFLDAQYGWAAGNGFFSTTDGGQSWTNNSITQMGSVDDIFFLDRQYGWASGNGGRTYRTTDGGVTWSFADVGTINTLGAIWFTDRQTGWASNNAGQLYKSTDGGQSWTLHRTWSGTCLSTIQFFDALEGWAIGCDTFLHTVDGGQTWQRATVPAGTWAVKAHFVDRTHGWAVGPDVAVRTTDGGQTWSAIPDGTDEWLSGVHFFDTQSGVLAGEGGTLKTTTDGGQTWASVQSGGRGTTHALDAVDAQHAWAGSDGGSVLVTEDGGAYWERVQVAGFDNYGEINGVDFVDTTNGWAIGDQPGFAIATSARIVRSTDGGRTWDVKLARDNVFTTTIEAVDPMIAYAFGFSPPWGDFLWRTSDGGDNWENVSPGGIVEAIEFLDANTGWIAGGAIKKTTDAGVTWTTQHSPQYTIEDISFADSMNGWAVGWFGTLLRTTDGGQSWRQQNPGTGTSVTFHGVSAISPTTAWIVGSRGYVARTTDGGETWTKELVSSGLDFSVLSEHFLDAEHGWLGTADIPPEGGIWSRSGQTLSPWSNLGFSLQGPLGIPALNGYGPLTGGSMASLKLSNAVGNTPVVLVMGTWRINYRYRGVMLVPAPDLLLPLVTSLTGEVSLGWPWPNGIPPGTPLYFHTVLLDGSPVVGFSLSNALEARAR